RDAALLFDVADDRLRIGRFDKPRDAEAEYVHALLTTELKSGDELKALIRKPCTFGKVIGELRRVEVFGVIGHTNKAATERYIDFTQLGQCELAVRVGAMNVNRAFHHWLFLNAWSSAFRRIFSPTRHSA